MAKDKISITAVELGAARKHAQRILSQKNISDDSLSELVTLYTAATRAGLCALHALEVASGLVHTQPTSSFVRSSSLEDFLTNLSAKESFSEQIAGLHAYTRSFSQPPPRVLVGEVQYQRAPSYTPPKIIGCDKQVSYAFNEVKKLFMYNPSRQDNCESSTRHEGILFYGPPGTGKTSLCRYLLFQAQRLSGLSGIPFCHETFVASDYSKWVGESSQSLHEKFLRVSNPSGVGMLILDDIDMVVQSRDDASSSHSGLQVTGLLMQLMDGLQKSLYGNTLFVSCTNRSDKLDDALFRRFTARVHVPLYSSLDQYASLVASSAPWASHQAHALIASYALDRSFSPAQTVSLLRSLNAYRCGEVDEAIFSLPLSEREQARKATYRSLSVSEVSSFLSSQE